MFINTFIDAIRNRLFLNVVRKELAALKDQLNLDTRTIVRQELNALKDQLSLDIRATVQEKLDEKLRQSLTAQKDQLNSDTRAIVQQELEPRLAVTLQTIKNNRLNVGEYISKFISAAIINRQTFSPYKNFLHGKSVVICGAGPSLKDYVPIDGAVHIALNRAFLFDKVQFDFIFAQDYEGVMMAKDELRDYRKGKCEKLFGKLFRDNVNLMTNFPESYISECNAKTFATDAFYPDDLFVNHPFIAEIDSRAISCSTNVGMTVMQFALWMNPDKIYIVGCDHSGPHFTTKGLSEVHSEADKRISTETWKVNLKRMRKQWRQFRKFAQIYYPDTKIISVNPVGLKGIFTDWNQSTGEITENEAPPLISLFAPYTYEESRTHSLPDYPASDEKCEFCIDIKEKKDNFLYIFGWAYKDDDEIDVYAGLGDRTYRSQKLERGEVKEAFGLHEYDKGFQFFLPYSEDAKVMLYFVNETEEVIYKAEI